MTVSMINHPQPNRNGCPKIVRHREFICEINSIRNDYALGRAMLCVTHVPVIGTLLPDSKWDTLGAVEKFLPWWFSDSMNLLLFVGERPPRVSSSSRLMYS